MGKARYEVILAAREQRVHILYKPKKERKKDPEVGACCTNSKASSILSSANVCILKISNFFKQHQFRPTLPHMSLWKHFSLKQKQICKYLKVHICFDAGKTRVNMRLVTARYCILDFRVYNAN